jgi:hypothetical protein
VKIAKAAERAAGFALIELVNGGMPWTTELSRPYDLPTPAWPGRRRGRPIPPPSSVWLISV